MQPAIIADIFFLHDRGKWNTLYWVVYMGSLMVGPIISGPMAEAVGWRAFWWLNVGLLGLTAGMVFFMFPETKWDRGTLHEQVRQASVSHDPNEKVAGNGAGGSPSSNAANDYIKPSVAATSNIDDKYDLEGVKTAERDPFLGKGKPKRSQWMFFQRNAHPFRSIAMDLWIPWKLFAFPIVEFASFVVSWSCSSFLTLNLTQSQNFAAPPYNFSSQSIGFMNFAILVGALIGLATAGPLSDWVSMRATKKNGGIREPEMRLPAMVPYVVIMYLGNIIVSVGYEKKWNWAVIVIIGFTCAGIQVAALPAIASTYAVDSYKPVAGSLFVSITVNKNVWGYGFSKFITPWSEEVGFIPPIMTNASLILLWCLFGILFYYKGKTFRRWSKNSTVHRM
jgi:MFS family permease